MSDRTHENLTTADIASRTEDAGRKDDLRRRQDDDARRRQDEQTRRRQDDDARAQMRQDDDFAARRATADEAAMAPLFREQDLNELKNRWSQIQTGFVDEPRRAVEEADGLVASTIGRLAESFADERTHLEGQWARGDDVSTEDLRLALRRYRSFFDRLLSV
jgi:hypothetical protein